MSVKLTGIKTCEIHGLKILSTINVCLSVPEGSDSAVFYLVLLLHVFDIKCVIFSPVYFFPTEEFYLYFRV